MPLNMVAGTALCCQCSGLIRQNDESCQAMGMIFHTACFTCCCCYQPLKGGMFYKDHGKLYCPEDYMYCGFQQNVDRCSTCGHMITNKVLKALDKSYHVECFRCVICNECLDGAPFTINQQDNKIYCIKDYYLVHTNPCAACGQPFAPEKDQFSVKSVVALNKEFHSECFICEECHVNLIDQQQRDKNLFCPRYDSVGNIHLICRKCSAIKKTLTTTRVNKTSPLSSSSSSLSSSSINKHI